jgi:hypothetical protein
MLSVENLYFAINPDDYPHIETEKIQSLIVDDIEFRKCHFETMKHFYNFLIENRNRMTYIKYEIPYNTINKKSYWEVYLLNGKNHRLDGPALIKSTYKESFNLGKEKPIITESIETYFIDGVQIEKECFKKHPKVREVKLKRIIYKNDDNK